MDIFGMGNCSGMGKLQRLIMESIMVKLKKKER